MGTSIAPGPVGQETAPLNISDGTQALTASPTPGLTRGPEDVSFEIGASFQPVSTTLALDDAGMQVLAWLRENQRSIIDAEQKFRVDRRAIAGAIAWEMLENVKGANPISVGPGKMHLYDASKNNLPGSLFNLGVAGISGDWGRGTLAREVEDRGYLPSQTYESRKTLLATPHGAITYIAASMAAIADIAGHFGHDDIRGDPVVLTNVYNSKTLTTWTEHLRAKKAKSGTATPLGGGNQMDMWVGSNLRFLEDGVGVPNLPESGLTPSPIATPPAVPTPLASTGTTAGKQLVVAAGDTLSGIAQREYGSMELWPLIYDRNKAAVGSNPNLIQPGLPLVIEPLSKYSADEIAEARRRAPSWRSFE